MRGNMRSFGEILTSLREERGIYQKELAAILKDPLAPSLIMRTIFTSRIRKHYCSWLIISE